MSAPYLPALLLTIGLEVPVALAVLAPRAGLAPSALAALAVNLVSHPILWFGLVPGLRAAGLSHQEAVLAAEAVVWLGEAAAYAAVLRPLDWRRAAAAAILANALSAFLGGWIYASLR